MKPRRVLIHRINRAFILQGLFISIAAILSVFFAKIVLEETLIKEAIRQEAGYFWQQYETDRSFPLPDTQNLTGYFDIEKLPDDIKAILETATREWNWDSYERIAVEDLKIIHLRAMGSSHNSRSGVPSRARARASMESSSGRRSGAISRNETNKGGSELREELAGKRVLTILSGANVDFHQLGVIAQSAGVLLGHWMGRRHGQG